MTKAVAQLRRRLFVDPQVQGHLAWRVCLYWLSCLLTVVFMVFCYRIVTGPVRPFFWHFNELATYLGPAVVASLVLLPLVVMDVIRLSHRFVGPLVRLRRSLRALARGESIEPLRFRNGDFWQEFADELNAVAERLQSLKRAEQATSPAPEGKPTPGDPSGTGFPTWISSDNWTDSGPSLTVS